MKHTKLLTMATVAGLSIGGLGSVAVAQSYDDAPTAAVEAVEAEDNAELEGNARFGARTQRQARGQAAFFQDVDVEADTDTEAEGDRGGRSGHRGGCNLDEAAEAIGIDEADLAAALENGDSIADVAEANGVSADAVIDAMVEAKVEKLDAKVAEGRITQEEADEKLANAEAKIADRVNGVEDASDA